MKTPESNEEHLSTHSILTGIKNGTLDALTLKKPERQLCVEALMLQGYETSSLASLLKVCDKTIKRDIHEIFERNALYPSHQLARRLIGEFAAKTNAHYSSLVRMARGKEGTIQERANAEYCAWKVSKDAIQIYQELGYLPKRPLELSISNKDQSGESSYESIRQTIEGLEVLANENGPSPEVQLELKRLKLKLERAEIEENVFKLSLKEKDKQNESIE